MSLYNQEIFIKKESVWGTKIDPTQPTTKLTEVLGGTQDFNYTIENSNEVYNTAPSSKPLYKSIGNASFNGSINFKYLNAMPFVVMLGGEVEATNPIEDEAPYKWTIKPQDKLPSFTASINALGTNPIRTQLIGCYPTSLSFSVAVDGTADGTLDFVFKDTVENDFTAPTTLTLPSVEPIDGNDLKTTIGTLADIPYITGVDFSVSRSAQLRHSLGNRKATQNIMGKYQGVTGSINAWVEDSATAKEIEAIVKGAEGKDIQLKIKDWNGTPSKPGSMYIKLKDAVFSSGGLNFPLDDGFSYNFSFTAKFIEEVQWFAPVTVASSEWGIAE